MTELPAPATTEPPLPDKGAPDKGGNPAAGNRRAALLLSLWQVRADLYRSLEEHTRRALAGSNTIGPDELEDFIEQQVTTEQTEYIAQFLFVLRTAGCTEPGPLGLYIDSHNAMIDRLLAELENARDTGRPVGSRLKQRLWRLRSARFNERMKAGTLERLGEGRLVLSLKDLERFMAMHMDPTLCRDRLDALVKAGLLADEVRPNIRLIWSDGALEAIVGRHLDDLWRQLKETALAPPL
jgi:hypothetical protein